MYVMKKTLAVAILVAALEKEVQRISEMCWTAGGMTSWGSEQVYGLRTVLNYLKSCPFDKISYGFLNKKYALDEAYGNTDNIYQMAAETVFDKFCCIYKPNFV